MKEKFASNNIENDKFVSNNEEVDYKNLLSRLKEISATISLLEKQYFKKF